MHPPCQRFFANTANPVFIPVSIFHQTMVEELRGAGGSNVKGYDSKFNQNSHRYSPAQSLCFLTHYTATKNSFTLLEIIIGQEKIHGLPVQHLFKHLCVADLKIKKNSLLYGSEHKKKHFNIRLCYSIVCCSPLIYNCSSLVSRVNL